MDTHCTAIILAGGRGRRMHTETPKQFLSLAGKELFLYAVETYARCPFVTDIVVVIPEEDKERCEALLAPQEKVRALSFSGEERFDSVYAGLSAIDWPCDVVLIHDGARPLTKEEDIETVYRTVLTDEAAVAAHPSKDTIKIVDDRQIVTDTLERSHLWNVQTPQGFSRTLIEKAYAELMADRKNNAPIFVTDDASAVELYTEKKVKLVETSSWNLKVTTPEDLEQIGILLEYRKKTTEENT
ncbi:MAG: 2-C-methyl-D-erythritol 4-phosphate cytidylyltransferase [Lachnospiraceae bacterium]|nr:2-C-methyl-D-erythritol 4-phosphate cytidylyltransferase [Lachnospiraceae bacterium]